MSWEFPEEKDLDCLYPYRRGGDLHPGGGGQFNGGAPHPARWGQQVKPHPTTSCNSRQPETPLEEDEENLLGLLIAMVAVGAAMLLLVMG